MMSRSMKVGKSVLGRNKNTSQSSRVRCPLGWNVAWMSGGVTTRGLVGEVDSAFPIKLQTKKFITVM